MGGHGAVLRVSAMTSTAQCSGPDGDFETTVQTRFPDRVHFIQRFQTRPDFETLLVGHRGWRLAGNATASIDRTVRAVVRGREVHAMLVRMEERFSDLVRQGEAPFAGQRCLVLRGRDYEGFPAAIYISAADATPVGFRLTDSLSANRNEVLIDVGDWQSTGDLRLPRRATYTTGAKVWRYVYTELEINPRGLGPLDPPT